VKLQTKLWLPFADIAHPRVNCGQNCTKILFPSAMSSEQQTHKHFAARAEECLIGKDYENPFGQVAPKLAEER